MMNNFFKTEEARWRNSSPRITNKELVDIFPEIKHIIPVKINGLEHNRETILKKIIGQLNVIRGITSDDFSSWFVREWIKVTDGVRLIENERQIRRFKRLIQANNGSKPRGYISEEDIRQAMDSPIEGIVSQHTRLNKCGNNLRGLCPLHSEKTPSFYVYPETNSCWCFGCNQGGNPISLVRLLYDHSFIEAVKHLIKIIN